MTTARPAAYTTPSGSTGRFGPFGGRYVPETLVPALEALEAAWLDLKEDESFRVELDDLLGSYVGRPTPIHRARAAESRAIIPTSCSNGF